MKAEINLTIIIPHYNTPVLLKKLIDSIPDSDDIQIIVVDDNSDKEFEKFREVKVFYHKRVEFYKNSTGIRSAGSCRNIGLAYAKGKWILFADADDYFLPNMYDVVQKFFDSEYDMVFFTPTSVFIDTGVIAGRHIKYKRLIKEYLNNPNKDNMLALKTFRAMVPWSKLIKREIIEKNHVCFSQSLYANDICFSVAIGFFSKKITASEEVIYCVTRGDDSLSTCIDEKAYDIRLEENIKRWKFLVEHYGLKTCKKQHMTGAEALFTAFQRHLGIKKYIEIVKKLRKNNIPIFYPELLRLNYLFKVSKQNMEVDKQDKKYYWKTGSDT